MYYYLVFSFCELKFLFPGTDEKDKWGERNQIARDDIENKRERGENDCSPYFRLKQPRISPRYLAISAKRRKIGENVDIGCVTANPCGNHWMIRALMRGNACH